MEIWDIRDKKYNGDNFQINKAPFIIFPKILELPNGNIREVYIKFINNYCLKVDINHKIKNLRKYIAMCLSSIKYKIPLSYYCDTAKLSKHIIIKVERDSDLKILLKPIKDIDKINDDLIHITDPFFKSVKILSKTIKLSRIEFNMPEGFSRNKYYKSVSYIMDKLRPFGYKFINSYFERSDDLKILYIDQCIYDKKYTLPNNIPDKLINGNISAFNFVVKYNLINYIENFTIDNASITLKKYLLNRGYIFEDNIFITNNIYNISDLEHIKVNNIKMNINENINFINSVNELIFDYKILSIFNKCKSKISEELFYEMLLSGIRYNEAYALMLLDTYKITNEYKKILSNKIKFETDPFNKRLIYPNIKDLMIGDNIDDNMEKIYYGLNISEDEKRQIIIQEFEAIDEGMYILINTFIEYPEILEKYIMCGKTLPYFILDVFYPNATLSQLWYLYLTGRKLEIEIDQDYVIRKTRYNLLDLEHKLMIKNLFNFKYVESMFRHKEHRLEKCIIDIYNEPDDQLVSIVKKYGMNVPDIILPDEVHNYITTFIWMYLNVNEDYDYKIKPEDLNLFTGIPMELFIIKICIYSDQSIIDYFSFNDIYLNRIDLITKIFDILNIKNFGIIDNIHNGIINTETYLATDINELTPPYLTYGDHFEKRVFEMDEILYNFEVTGDIYNLRDPSNPSKYYTINEINKLQSCIKFLNGDENKKNTISNNLNLIIQSNQRKDEMINNFYKLVKGNNELKRILFEYFNKIFLIGMYMRKWKGIGPYPHKTTETKIDDYDPNDIVSEKLEELYIIMEKIKNENYLLWLNLSSLQVINYDNIKNVYETDTSGLIFDYLDKIRNGKFCIRVSSTYLCITGYYYCNILLDYIIPDFDVLNIQRIS